MDTVKRTMRRRRIRAKVRGSADRPRVSVFRGVRTMTVQFIDDNMGKTLLAANVAADGKGTKTERARQVGTELAQEAVKQGMTRVVFDRGGYRYHGRIKALAEALREGGLTL